MTNTLLVLLDGTEDDPNPELGGKKPFDVAEMPFIKSNVKTRGRTTGKGYTHLFLNELFTGHPPKLQRAVLEAMGFGMEVTPGRAAFRLSPAYIRNGMIEWAYNTDEFRERLQAAVTKHLPMLDHLHPQFRFFISSRAIVTIDSDEIPELPGPPKNTPYVEVPGDMGKMVRAVAEELDGLTDYPWGVGTCAEQYPHFRELDNLTAFSDSPTSLGVCASLGYGYKVIDDLEERFAAAEEALKHGNVFLHIDEIDEYSHMKKWKKKVEILEETDRLMRKHFSNAERIFYFIDHGTSCVTGEHLPVTVPFWTTFDTDIGENEMVPLAQVIPRLFR
ncbi:MAG: phosphoglycerate mutase [Candidatus Methanomethylophilaceae archaeon]|nr:phosphoglycerate mutase [Candidatus Methanomethylophilaceae archaeon]